ncbi:MAG: response regulator [Planctomycetota bacterium]|nr:MAG: response regulator [Planctomycetota bacterium]
MNRVVRVAIVDPRDASRQATKNLLLGIESIWLEAECSNYEYFVDVLTQAQPDIAIINLDADTARGLALISEVVSACPGTHVFVISSSQEGSLILQTMRHGAKEFLPAPLKLDDFLDALERIEQFQRGGDDVENVRSRLISVIGASGGVGCTSLAVNLACSLAQDQKHNVVLLDLDLALGDADVWLDIIPDYTIQDVVDNIDRLDYALLKRSLTRHDCGAYLLPRPVHLADRPSITPEALRRVLALLKATFSHVLLDLSKGYGEMELSALEVSDEILLVTQFDLPGIRNVVRVLQYFEEFDGLADKTRVVVNRMGLEDSQISLNKAVETIGREIFAEVPNDYATMVESRNNGIPLLKHAPRARVTRAIDQLAQKFAAEAEEQGTKGKSSRRGLFGFLKSGT